jgi:hypothetical protein
VFYVPYDPAIQVLVHVQVPVMKEPTEIKVTLPEGIRPQAVTPNEDGSVTLKLGTGPAAMFPFPDTPEDAGTYRRSLNSQRVIEVGAPRPGAQRATLQIKGGGVPAYGFNHADLEGKSGGEYFDLKGDAQLSEFHGFAAKLFKLDSDICQLGNAYVQGAPTGLPSGDDKAGRYGGLSFRVDNAAGLRFPDLVEDLAARGNLSEETESHHLLEFAKETEVIKDTKNMLATGIQTAIKNYAAANLLGMVYEDSNLHNLTDLGARGSFPDAGTIGAVDKTTKTLFFETVDKIKDLCIPGQDPRKLHRDALVEHLIVLAGAADTDDLRAISKAAGKVAELPLDDSLKLKIFAFARTLAGNDPGANNAQEAYRKGPEAYKQYLAGVLETYDFTRVQ